MTLNNADVSSIEINCVMYESANSELALSNVDNFPDCKIYGCNNVMTQRMYIGLTIITIKMYTGLTIITIIMYIGLK